MKSYKVNVTFRMDHYLKEILRMIAEEQRRSFSNQLNVALEEWVQLHSQLHPQFVKDIKEALKSGKPEAVWKE